MIRPRRPLPASRPYDLLSALTASSLVVGCYGDDEPGHRGQIGRVVSLKRGYLTCCLFP